MYAFDDFRSRIANNTAWPTEGPRLLDDALSAITGEITSGDAWRLYNVFEIEGLLNDASGLVEKCLAYRREFFELAAVSARRKRDYELYTAIQDKQERLETAAWLEQRHANDAKGHRAAADAFAPEEAGFAASARATAASLQASADDEKARKDLIRERWTQDRIFQKALQDDYDAPGHPLNLDDRASRVWRLLLDNFAIAIRKMQAATLGLKQVFGRSVPFDPGLQPLDAAVAWLREQADWLDREQSWEVEREYILDLRRYVADFAASRTKRDFTFTLTPKETGLRKYDRIRAVGLSLRLLKGEEPNASYLYLPCSLYLPTQFPGEAAGQRSVALSDVSTFLPANSPAHFAGRSIRNLSPLGAWRLKTAGLFHTARSAPTKGSYVDGINLHLRIARRSKLTYPPQVVVPRTPDTVPGGGQVDELNEGIDTGRHLDRHQWAGPEVDL